MVCDGKVCQECARNCLFTHQKQKSASPVVTCFFKIMLGDDYLKVLYLPPSFVRKVRNVIGQPSYLEDSTGQQWPITISILNGHMAIQEGWHKFALDHLLEVGDFLTFFYFKGSHFVVQIYGKSGCERLKFKRRRGRPRKRSSEEEEIVVLDEPIRPLNINLGGKPGSSTPVASESEFQHGQSIPKVHTASNSCSDFGKRQSFPKTISKDESVLMFNTNARYNQGEDRTYLHDLSSFEMGRNEFNPDKAKQSSLGGEMIPVHSQIRKQTESTDNDIQIAKNGEYHISGHYNDVLFGAFPTKSAENSKMSKGMPNVLSDYPTAERNNAVLGNAQGFSSENETLSLGSGKITGSKYTAIPKYSRGSVSIPTVKFSSGGETVAVKKERVEMGDVAFGLHQTSTDVELPSIGRSKSALIPKNFDSIPMHQDQFGKEQNIGIKCAPMPFRAVRNVNSIVKTKPDMQSALVPCVAANPILVEVKCLSYMELPTSLPPFDGRNKGGNSQLIFLRDSVGRLWPVLCTEILDVTALVDGWQRFCQENDIQPGDLCKFKCENSIPCIYGVDESANQF